jgi:hypothetical protein
LAVVIPERPECNARPQASAARSLADACRRFRRTIMPS